MNKERRKKKQTSGWKNTHHLIDACDSFAGISVLVEGDDYPKLTKLIEKARFRIRPSEVHSFFYKNNFIRARASYLTKS